MADAREKKVLDYLIDTYSRQEYVFRNVTPAGDDVGLGDVVELPFDSAPTSVAGGTRAAPTPSIPSITTLTVDQFPSKRRLHPRIDEIQLVRGNVVMERARMYMMTLMAEADDYLLALIETAALAGALADLNPTGAVALGDFHNAEAQMLDQEGVEMQNLMYAYHPLGIPQIKGFFDPPRANDIPGAVGAAGIQTINGIPAVVSRSVPLQRTATAPAAVLFDRTKVFMAEQQLPYVRIVQDAESVGDVLQVAHIYGGAVIPGYARIITTSAA